MKRRLHTTISDEASRIIEKYIAEYGRVNNLIEEALAVFDRYRSGMSEAACKLVEIMEEQILSLSMLKLLNLLFQVRLRRLFATMSLKY